MLGCESPELSVLFVNSAKMKELNTRYRGIERSTDVLSFPLSEGGPASCNGPLGDVVICVPKARKQAVEYGVTFHDELLRLLVHGLLHLLGFDHERNAYQRRRMEKKEREILNALSTVA